MSQLETFVAPRPNFGLIRLMTAVNRVFMLKGVAGLRDLPPFDEVAGLRGVANVRCIDFPLADQQRLGRAARPGNACFVTPNHPEFFTDWMVDKEIAARLFPKAAFWATNAIVNGLGRMAQKFWLANNLIAQIPGNSAPAKNYSVRYAAAGNVVLLHPEGQVGWHRNHVAPLMPGAAEMAQDVVRLSRTAGEQREVWLAPVVWKLALMDDVEPALSRECAYVERKLKIHVCAGENLAQRVYRVYADLLARDEAAIGLVSSPGEPFASRRERVVETLSALIAKAAGAIAAASADAALKAGRKRLRQLGKNADPMLKEHVTMLTRALRIGAFAWEQERVGQEEIAEHIKRLRADYCFGSWRDTLNRYAPQPAGPRRAYIRAAEPIAMHQWTGSAQEATAELRRRMQAILDSIVVRQAAPDWSNPFR